MYMGWRCRAAGKWNRGLTGAGTEGGRTAQALFAALDTDNDGTLTRAELESGFNSWFSAWDTTRSEDLNQSQISAGLSTFAPSAAGGQAWASQHF